MDFDADRQSAQRLPGVVDPFRGTTSDAWPKLYVVIVTYRAQDFVSDCLKSLFETNYPNLRVVIVDNDSDDGTLDAVKVFATSHAEQLTVVRAFASQGFETRCGRPYPPQPANGALTVLDTRFNGGFAWGVNRGLEVAMADAAAELIWILNPDTVVEPQTPFALVRCAAAMGRFAVIGGRVVYFERPDRVHCDGGVLHRLSGTAVSCNLGRLAAECPMPDPANLHYIPGVSMLVSRDFIEEAGLLPEHWFLYFEEIDWQLRRGVLPLGIAADARVRHRAGASIGSGTSFRRAGAMSVYFSCRNLLPFVAHWQPLKLPAAYMVAYYKLVRQWGLTRDNLAAMLRGLHNLPPPRAVRERLGEDVWQRILSHRRLKWAGTGLSQRVQGDPRA